MQRLGSQYSRILVESKNLGALLNEVEELVVSFDEALAASVKCALDSNSTPTALHG